MRAGAGRIGGDLLPGVDSLASVEVAALADDAGGRGGPGIFGFERADLILYRFAHVPDAQISVRLVEHGLSARLARRTRVAPVQLDLLPGVALDDGDPDPDCGGPRPRVPLLDLV